MGTFLTQLRKERDTMTENTSIQSPHLLSAGAAALLLGVSVRTIHRWRSLGKLTALVLPSGRYRYREEDLFLIAKQGGSS